MGRRRKVLTKLAAGKGGLNALGMTRGERLTNRMEAIKKVFGNPLLLDKIVEYSVYTPDKEFCYGAVSYRLRLVNKTWLQSVSRVLTTSNSAVKKLRPDTDTSFLAVDYLNTKVINNFVSVFSEASRVHHSFLPLLLELKPHYFIKENQKTFKNLFEYCGDLVLNLIVNFPFNGGSMPLEFGQLGFQNLRRFHFTFDGQKTCIQTSARVSKTNANGCTFLKQILQHAKKLQLFDLAIEQQVDKKQAEIIDSIKLPNSITNVRLICQPTGMQLKFLSTSKLANLSILILRFEEAAEEEQIVFEILDNLKTQLKTFHLTINGISFVPDYQFYVKLPLMEKLTTLKLFPSKLELLPRMEINLSKCVPNLTTLELLNFSESIFSTWIQDGLFFPSVKEVVIMISELKSPNEHILKQIQSAFPNIQKLGLFFEFCDIASLKYLFKNFNYLKELHLTIDGCSGPLTGYVFASTLLGISLGDAVTISHETDHDVEIPIDNPRSIMNMNDLHSLTLETLETADCHNNKDFYEMNSCIKYGFEKMPQLKNVTLLGGFKDFQRDD